METKHSFFTRCSTSLFFVLFGVITPVFLFLACNTDDPEPVNEEEVITTLTVTLAPQGGGEAVTLRFYDEDGEQGSIAPVITVSGPLAPSTTYAAIIELENETEDPAVNISEEIAGEAEQHLFCFGGGDLSVEYEDEDKNGLPLGLVTSWTTSDVAGATSVTVTLRHQAGTKTGECPGTGETDVEVTFDLLIE